MDLLREAVWERGHKMGGGEKEKDIFVLGVIHKTLPSPHSNHCPQKRGGFFFIPFTEEVKVILKRKAAWDFAGGPVVKTLRFQCSGCGFDPWSGKLRSHMPHCARPKKKKRKEKLSAYKPSSLPPGLLTQFFGIK